MSLSELSKILPQDQVSNDPALLETYGRDWTRAFKVNATAVVFPKSTEDVQKLVRWAREKKVALIPSGGRTGLSGGAVATSGEIILSLEKMNRIDPVNEIDRLVRCQAGAVTENLQEAAHSADLFFPVDFASRGSSQIGGNIATNAGGTKVIRYGLMRDWVASLEVVTGTGEILELNRSLIKNNAGFDFRHLFIGSEGSLGIITEATLRLTKRPKDLQVLLLASNDLSVALEILKRFQKALSLTAFEFFTEDALQHVLKKSDLSAPFNTPSKIYFLIEFENIGSSETDKALDVFEVALNEGLLTDGVLSQSDEQLKTFWRYREQISESLSSRRPYKNDISVLISKIPQFVKEVETLLQKQFSTLEIVWFGHIGDGNLHINVLQPETQSDESFREDCKKMSSLLFGVVEKFGGSISAEHGIGLVKKPYLHLSRSKEEISLMRSIKKTFDPDGILNPGKIFDL